MCGGGHNGDNVRGRFMSERYISLMVLFLIPPLSGCVAVAAGAAAGGATGYYISKDDDRASPQVSEDNAIAGRVRDRFAQDSELTAMKLDVDSYDNVVTLRGDAPNEMLAERAISLARSTQGVKGVRSEITIH